MSQITIYEFSNTFQIFNISLTIFVIFLLNAFFLGYVGAGFYYFFLTPQRLLSWSVRSAGQSANHVDMLLVDLSLNP